MSHNDTTLASYAFLPWIRRGVSTTIPRVDGAEDNEAPRANLDISVTVDPIGNTDNANLQLQLHGPGEVAGIDTNAIVRTYPQRNEVDAEPNYFAAIDFDQPDFPWRYTPARANNEDRLRPWLTLIVLTEDEVSEMTPGGSDGELPTVTVANAVSLPVVSQLWAWAHAQVSGIGDSSDEDISDVVNNEPERCVSRILCPRRLIPRQKYTAFVIPTFERGRRAGLNEAMTKDLDGLVPAWLEDQANIRLPIYYQWDFQTGIRGDFEYLARELKARVTPPNIGKKDIDVDNPGFGLSASTTPLEMEGALTSLQSTTSEWNIAEKQAFVTQLKSVLDKPADLLSNAGVDASVAPPLYGRWYCGQDRLNLNQKPKWFNEVNSDPRLRSANGLGTQAIQKEQQALMASAWEQMDELRELQEDYINAQLAREITDRFTTRHILSHDVETMLMLTKPIHSRVASASLNATNKNKTLFKAFKDSAVPKGVLEPQFRRISRMNGPISKKQGRLKYSEKTINTPTLLTKLNEGEISSTKPPVTSDDLSTVASRAKNIKSKWLTQKLLDNLRVVQWLLIIIFIVLLFLSFASVNSGLISIAVSAGVAAGILRVRLRQLRIKLGLSEGDLTPKEIKNVRPPANFVPLEGATNSHLPPDAVVNIPNNIKNKMVKDFKTGLVDLYQELNEPLIPAVKLFPVNFSKSKEFVSLKFNAKATIVAPLKARTVIAPWVRWDFSDEDPIEPPMPAPVFEDAMYKPLRDISAEWILPGAGEIPANTVSLLTTNQEFIESYMLGCNHEMTRELTYHEYRIDQRATYFQRFWESIEVLGETPIMDEMLDIKKIHLWDKTKGIGNNSARRPPAGGEYLVIIIRGELFNRYPNTIVYASKAKMGLDDDGSNVRVPSEEERSPVFQGRLDPDIHFFGFELVESDVRGSLDQDANLGWFFILEEQISEPRFGLDVPGSYGRQLNSWDDLAWSDLVSSAEEVDRMSYINLDNDLPNTSAINSEGVSWHANTGLGPTGSRASDIASISMQKPFRVAIHGADMMPPNEN